MSGTWSLSPEGVAGAPERAASFFNGWRSTGTMPATSQLDKLISITPISVLSCFRTIRDWFSLHWGAPSIHISTDGYNFPTAAAP
jgi:hypothetical protein